MKIGLEIHFQLKGSKLFCSCSTEGVKKDPYFQRKMTPTMSELGKIDRAAEYENIRNRNFTYYVSNNSCLVEADEEPPHDPDMENIKTTIIISMALHCNVMNYISFMRKIVIDGSNTSGFQRTGIIGMDGYIETSRGNVRISAVTLEEDAARKLSSSEDHVDYSLDRLGIPLVEISTEPDIVDENHAIETAKKIGFIVKSLKNFRGDVDSIRQDVNFSMGFGRVEIKGVSKLSMIREAIKYEVKRQLSLQKASEIINERGGVHISEFINVDNIFVNTTSNMIKKAFAGNKNVFAAKLENLNGLLKNGNFRLGKELADVTKNLGIGGLMHSDEFPGYGVSEMELNAIYDLLNKGEKDAVILVLTNEDIKNSLQNMIYERLNKIINMNLDETRAATESGETRYLRPLPGKERMYPETDIELIEIQDNLIKDLEKIVPEPMDTIISNLKNKYGLSVVESDALLNNNLYSDFVDMVNVYYRPKIIARILLQDTPEYEKKYGIKLENEKILKVLYIARNNKWERNTIEKALEILWSGNSSVGELEFLEELKTLDYDSIYVIVKKLIADKNINEKNIIPEFKNQTEKSFNPGTVMEIYKKLKGSSQSI